MRSTRGTSFRSSPRSAATWSWSPSSIERPPTSRSAESGSSRSWSAGAAGLGVACRAAPAPQARARARDPAPAQPRHLSPLAPPRGQRRHHPRRHLRQPSGGPYASPARGNATPGAAGGAGRRPGDHPLGGVRRRDLSGAGRPARADRRRLPRWQAARGRDPRARASRAAVAGRCPRRTLRFPPGDPTRTCLACWPPSPGSRAIGRRSSSSRGTRRRSRVSSRRIPGGSGSTIASGS